MKWAGGRDAFRPPVTEESTSGPSAESGVGVRGSFQSVLSPDPKPTNAALSGAGVGRLSACPEAGSKPAPALENRHNGSGRWCWEARRCCAIWVTMQMRPGCRPELKWQCPGRKAPPRRG